ncbi:hypothetical protein Sjap_018253 [Stephania japonica]|uniref:Uncharacterized protein n=1 Tax=Stephania japonica TaxID=461633 RepID=A0AAP0I7V0_9MAGN
MFLKADYSAEVAASALVALSSASKLSLTASFVEDPLTDLSPFQNTDLQREKTQLQVSHQ